MANNPNKSQIRVWCSNCKGEIEKNLRLIARGNATGLEVEKVVKNGSEILSLTEWGYPCQHRGASGSRERPWNWGGAAGVARRVVWLLCVGRGRSGTIVLEAAWAAEGQRGGARTEQVLSTGCSQFS